MPITNKSQTFSDSCQFTSAHLGVLPRAASLSCPRHRHARDIVTTSPRIPYPKTDCKYERLLGILERYAALTEYRNTLNAIIDKGCFLSGIGN